MRAGLDTGFWHWLSVRAFDINGADVSQCYSPIKAARPSVPPHELNETPAISSSGYGLARD
jgi:hypothetical protein